MTKFLNLKIPVENNLDEILGELERLGYQKYDGEMTKNRIIVEAYEDGIYCLFSDDLHVCKSTTLAELRSMTIETLKEMN